MPYPSPSRCHVLEYAEAMFIGFANLATRVNTAHGITSQGYSDACEIPLAARPEQSGVAPAV